MCMPLPFLSNHSSFGTLWGIGVGPGDPELLTLKAVRVLHAVQVIVYPTPVKGNGASLARRIVAAVLDDGLNRTEIALHTCFETDHVSSAQHTAYDRCASTIATHLTAGFDVAVLCEGDPLFFGSFTYIMSRLSTHFSIEVVPGVNSVSACSALVQQPFALSDDQVIIIPALRSATMIEAAITAADAIAIIKIGRHLTKVVAILYRLGLAERAWYVERVGQPGQQVHALTTAGIGNGAYFSMILVNKRKKM